MSASITSTETVLKLREARDRIIDLLGIGETYPVRDLPVPNDRLTVPFNSSAKIRVEDSEKQVSYTLRDKDGHPQGNPGTGSGDELTLITAAIHDDITFTIHARTPLGREADLLSTATVRVGLDVTIAATLTPDLPQPWLIDFGATITVLIPLSQDGVDYRLVRLKGDPAHLDDITAAAQDDIISAGGATVRGTGGPIQLPSIPLHDDSVVRIRVIKTFDPALQRQPETNVLNVRLPVFVRADTGLAVTIDPAPVVDYDAASFARVAATVSGIDYRPLVCPVADAMYAQGAALGPGLIAVPVAGQPDAVIRLPNLGGTAASDVPAGLSLASDWQPGAGADLRLPLPAAETDALVLIAARKTHDADSGPFQSFVWLTLWAARLVKPNPRQPVVLTVALAGEVTDGAMVVSGGQPGVYYTPRVMPAGTPIQPPAYVHQSDPLGESPFKGIGQIKLEVDFTVARGGQPPLPPLLAGEPIPVGTTLAIQAMRAQSRASVDLAATATILPVPNVALNAPLYDAGAVAQIQVPASRVGDNFALYRAGTDESKPESPAQDGNGQMLTLASAPVSPGTTLVLIASSTDPVQVRRRVLLPVNLRPSAGVTLQAALSVVPQGGSTAILVLGSEAGMMYQAIAGANPASPALPGNGSTLALPVGPLTATTIFSVVASRATPPAASVTLTETATVTVAPH